MSIPASFIQELLGRTDVVEVVGRHVQLKKSGANYMGLCPFHAEKSPSFSVSPSKQFYHCFGCGASGDAIKFLTEHTGATFVEAVHDLAAQSGLTVPDEGGSPQDRERARQQRARQVTLSDVLEKAGAAYRRHLRGSARAIDYLKHRGLSGEIARRFGLGYAPEGWRTLASTFARYDDPLLEEAGLVIVQAEKDDSGSVNEGRRYDRFRDRIMFPIRNVKGECIGFGGRVLGDEKPKYLNSPETPVFHKGRELYGLYEARPALREMGYALVTEGYMDVVALAQLGFPNAVATLGTACTPEHVHKLFRFTDSVVFSFDGDAAGRRAARKALDAALPHASDTRTVRFLFLPPEHDPDSFVRAHGSDAFSLQVAQALPLSRFLVEAAREGCDLGTAEGRARMCSNARPLWSALPDGALRRQLLGELAQLAQLGAADLAALWQEPAGAPAARRSDGAAEPSPDHADLPPEDRWAPAEPMPFASEPAAPYAARKPWQRRNGPPEPAFDRSPRTAPASRVDHTARLLLSHMEFVEELSHEHHDLLNAQPEPHRQLFAWIGGQFHEHGVQPWAVLRESLRGAGCENLAVRLMTGSHAQTEGELADLRAELTDLLARMEVDRLKQLENDALAATSHDPAALQRYRELFRRRTELERRQTHTTPGGS
ncbi:DNA primase [Xylophilus sp.]|uniref:DNA primase n=1 Tax=Xylophilus sp. TaxID=2653893 RepID=UPI0013B794B4|nr:DNA primase [Xylophilus sp.]KAF1047061.1 MAG: DNA primase [Xylophilus sp.]